MLQQQQLPPAMQDYQENTNWPATIRHSYPATRVTSNTIMRRSMASLLVDYSKDKAAIPISGTPVGDDKNKRRMGGTTYDDGKDNQMDKNDSDSSLHLLLPGEEGDEDDNTEARERPVLFQIRRSASLGGQFRSNSNNNDPQRRSSRHSHHYLRRSSSSRRNLSKSSSFLLLTTEQEESSSSLPALHGGNNASCHNFTTRSRIRRHSSNKELVVRVPKKKKNLKNHEQSPPPPLPRMICASQPPPSTRRRRTNNNTLNKRRNRKDIQEAGSSLLTRTP